MSPRRWLEELAAELPRKYWDARELGFLFQNPDAVTSMMRSASRLRRAHALHGDREPLPSGNRHPFARLFEFPEDDE